MTEALQLLVVLAVGAGLAIYGHYKGVSERRADRADPRQRPLFSQSEADQHHANLVTR